MGKRVRASDRRFKSLSEISSDLSKSKAAPVGLEMSRRENTEAVLVEHLAKRMPFVYAIAIVNILLIAYAFYGTVTDLHLALVTCPLVLTGLLRAVYWHPKMILKRSKELVSRDLKLLPFTGTAVAAGLMVFGLSLYPFGSDDQQSLIHYLATLTTFTGILGLSHSPRTALGMILLSVVPSVSTFLYIGHKNAWSVSIAMLFVSLLLLLIARTQYAGFLDLVESKIAIQQKAVETAELNNQLRHYAYFDDLTLIANRRSFLSNLEEYLSSEQSDNPWLGLIDLDGFKSVNDIYGHRAGDDVLTATAERISSFPGVIECGRLGGDEFGFLLSGSVSEIDAIQCSRKLADLIAESVSHGSHLHSVKTSIGLRKTQGLTTSECIERADWALFKAKRESGSVTVFSSADEQVMQERNRITHLFDRADLASQLKVVFQPIIDFDTGQVQSVEALARWQTASGKLIMPDIFIPLAESTHRTSELTKIMIVQAIRELPSALQSTPLHINLSVNDISNEESIEWLLSANVFESVPRTQVVLELTETAILTGGNSAIENLNRLRESGFRIALDDFGVGHSSLSRIHKLPIDQIKIDKSFCCGNDAVEQGWAMIATILALSRQIEFGERD